LRVYFENEKGAALRRGFPMLNRTDSMMAMPAFEDLSDEVKDQIAIHEAGHAFMAIALGFSIDEVSIGFREMLTKGFSDGGVTMSETQRRAAVRYDRASKTYTREAAERDYAERLAMIASAGYLAECVWMGQFMKHGDRIDKRAVEEVLRPYYPSDVAFNRADERLRQRVLRLFTRSRSAQAAVPAIADALRDRRRLTGSEVQAIVRRVKRGLVMVGAVSSGE
jgi:hypothetical protein